MERQLLENAVTLLEPADKQTNASYQPNAQLEQFVGKKVSEHYANQCSAVFRYFSELL